jgi:hypothetical protein
MEKCSAETQAGNRCKRNAKINGKCSQHSKILNTAILMCGHRWNNDGERRCKRKANHGLFCTTHRELTDEERCTHVKGRVQCVKRRANRGTLCMYHVYAEERKLWTTFKRENILHFRDMYVVRAHANNINPWMEGYFQPMNVCIERCLHFKFYRLATDTRTDEQIVDMFPVVPRVPIVPIQDTRPELQRLATDNQNVHTAAVSQQTNKGIESLIKIPIPEDQDTMLEIRNAWTKMYVRVAVDERIYTDMNIWYNQPTCCKLNDWLYRNVLDHLWARIKAEPKKDVRREMIKRLQQECAESFQMCCIGHINRLINVMIGFDDDFKPQMSKGEILQNKFAEIAKIEDDTDKYIQATAVLAELGVVGDEAAVWLDALV